MTGEEKEKKAASQPTFAAITVNYGFCSETLRRSPGLVPLLPACFCENWEDKVGAWEITCSFLLNYDPIPDLQGQTQLGNKITETS